MNNKQQGMTLITVLIVVLLVSALGLMAVKQSTTTLEIATNAQVDVLLRQSSDTVMRLVDKEVSKSKSKMCQPWATLSDDQRKRCLNDADSTQVFGYLLQQGDDNDELAFCYRPLSANAANLYRADLTTPLTQETLGRPALSSAVCNSDNKTDFNSNRRVVMTQVHIQRMKNPPIENGAGTELGDSGLALKIFQSYTVHVISASNIFKATTDKLFNECFKRPANKDLIFDGKETITECLSLNGVPFSAQNQIVNLPSP